MTTRRSLRDVPDVLDTENEPAAPTTKRIMHAKKPGRSRAALTELTNAIEKGIAGGKKSITKIVTKKGRVHRTTDDGDEDAEPPRLTALKPRTAVKRTAAAAAAEVAVKKARKLRSVPTEADLPTVTVDMMRLPTGSGSSLTESASSSESPFHTPPEGNTPASERQDELVSRLNAENADRRSTLPDGVIDFDAESRHDLFGVPEYVADVFRYYRQREGNFGRLMDLVSVFRHKAKKELLVFLTPHQCRASCVKISPYLETVQADLTEMMRAILVDWMVEVQESFELNHETLYMAVQLVDTYLGHVVVSREALQLVGATAIFMACKFDERLPPPLDDFLYICEDAYARREVIMTEMKMLRTVNFDLGLPVSYRFLRRYARCCKLSIEVLTLARYILEMSLMEYQFITTAGSRMAAAALSLAVLMRVPDQFQSLRPTIEHFSEYKTEDFADTLQSLNAMLQKPPSAHLKTIRAKYSHAVFHQVAKIPVLEVLPTL